MSPSSLETSEGGWEDGGLALGLGLVRRRGRVERRSREEKGGVCTGCKTEHQSRGLNRQTSHSTLVSSSIHSRPTIAKHCVPCTGYNDELKNDRVLCPHEDYASFRKQHTLPAGPKPAALCKVLLEPSHTCSSTRRPQLRENDPAAVSSCDRGHLAHKTPSVDCLALYTKSAQPMFYL